MGGRDIGGVSFADSFLRKKWLRTSNFFDRKTLFLFGRDDCSTELAYEVLDYNFYLLSNTRAIVCLVVIDTFSSALCRSFFFLKMSE